MQMIPTRHPDPSCLGRWAKTDASVFAKVEGYEQAIGAPAGQQGQTQMCPVKRQGRSYLARAVQRAASRRLILFCRAV